MKRIHKVTLALFILIAAILTAYNHRYPSSTFRYRMTVVIETPEGLKTGSAVREVTVSREPNIFPAAGGTFYNVTQGEAVVIDLGPRGVVFAVMRGVDNDVDYAHRVALDTLKGKEKNKAVFLPPDQYPMFVRYRNFKDADSLDVVYRNDKRRLPGDDLHKPRPIRLKNRFEEIFGAGVKIKQIEIELTDDPVTFGIQKYLPSKDGKPQPVTPGDFLRGEGK